ERARHVAVDAVAVGVLEAIIRLVLARRDAGWFRALSAGSARSPGQLWGRACSVSDGSTEGRRTRTLASSTSNLGSSGRRAPRCGGAPHQCVHECDESEQGEPARSSLWSARTWRATWHDPGFGHEAEVVAGPPTKKRLHAPFGEIGRAS